MHKLSFCRITIIDQNIAEMVIKGEIEVTAQMIEELFYFIRDEMAGNVSIIVNKVTQYTYKFDALVKLSVSDLVKNVAIVAYDEKTTSISEYMKDNFNKSGKNIQVFSDRGDALAWLRTLSV